MKRNIRKISIMLMVMVLCFSTVILVKASTNIPSATSDFYVNDFAGVFTEAEKSRLMRNAVDLANELDGIQVVVTTVKSLDGDTIENYAYNMYNQYGIGKNDMGLLILLATEDRQIRVEVGRSMEGYINDSKAGRLIDKYAIPSLAENKFNDGLISLQEAFITEIRSCVNSDATAEDNNNFNVNVDWRAVCQVIITICLFGAIGWLVVLFVKSIKRENEEKKQYIQSLNDEITQLTNKNKDLSNMMNRLYKDKNHLQETLDTTRKALFSQQSRHKRILTIYPDADKKVDEMIETEKIASWKQAARRVDELVCSVINLKPDKSLVSRIHSIKSAYNDLTSDEAKYVESDINALDTLYNSCLVLKREYDEQLERERRRRLTEERKQRAADITQQLLAVISLVGVTSASDFSKLKQAKMLYYDLDSETRSYVDDSAVSKIEELLRRAKRAKDEEEEAERRRRASYNSSSSFRSSHSNFGGSSFRGGGGRSGGGGASRRF